jgi:hypothetical protein
MLSTCVCVIYLQYLNRNFLKVPRHTQNLNFRRLWYISISTMLNLPLNYWKENYWRLYEKYKANKFDNCNKIKLHFNEIQYISFNPILLNPIIRLIQYQMKTPNHFLYIYLIIQYENVPISLNPDQYYFVPEVHIFHVFGC